MIGLVKTVWRLGLQRALRMNQAKRFGGETLIRGFFATPTIIALFKVGLFDALAQEGRINVESFAVQQGLDLAVLQPLCDYLYSLKILDREGSYYILDSRGRLLVDVVQGSIYSAGAYADVFYKLESLLRKESRFGVEVQRNIVLAAQGSGKAGKLIPFPAVIELIRTKRFTRVLDLGCGDGTFLVDLCKSNSHVNGYGVDISPEAIADGRHKVAEENLEDRIQLFVEDMFNLKTLKDQLTGVEAATAFFVLHEFLAYETDRVMEFFRTFREMFPNASLIICESVRHTPEQLRKRPGPILEFQLTHDLTGQRPITRQEWQTLFKKAGFTTIEEQYFDFIKTVIYTVH